MDPVAATAEELRETLREVYDPEIGINIVDLGLVYDVSLDDSVAQVKMTLTSPMCPMGPMIEAQVHTTLLARHPDDVKDVNIELVWSPPWDPRTMASEEAKMEMGFW